MRIVALLRGVNVGGRRKVPMADLRALAASAGFADAATYVQSGNLVATVRGGAAAAGAALERALEERFGFAVDVAVRTAAEWGTYAAGSPFPDAERDDPSHLLVLVSKRPPAPGAAEALAACARDGERVAAAAGALWVHFRAGVARTKLTPALIDRTVGSPTTARNWRTVLALRDLLARGGGPDPESRRPSGRPLGRPPAPSRRRGLD